MKNQSGNLFVLSFFLFVLSCSSAKEITENSDHSEKLIETGMASWYGSKFHGRTTANGEKFNMYDLTAAHKTLPFNSKVKVVNKYNGRSVIVRINDRGPFVRNRIIDLSKKAAEDINIIDVGCTEVDLFLLTPKEKKDTDRTDIYTVQIGSFKIKENAETVATLIPESRIEEAVVNGEKFFRVYIGSFDSTEEADDFKKSLLNEGFEGFVKKIID